MLILQCRFAPRGAANSVPHMRQALSKADSFTAPTRMSLHCSRFGHCDAQSADYFTHRGQD
ncbi:MAG: hypothetical protein ABJA62_06995 [Luteimonas sp.]